MGTFNKVLPAHQFLIALHVTGDQSQWKADVDTARKGGADGIIVIAHGNGTNEDVKRAFSYAKRTYGDWWIGVNFLGYSPMEALSKVFKVSGFWFDDVNVYEDDKKSIEYFRKVRERASALHSDPDDTNVPLLFPSVGMKYCRPHEDVAKVGKMLEPYADAIITSGNRTGEPPSLEKIRALRQAVKIRIGMCSGTSIENLRAFKNEGVNIFIVNTSLNVGDRLDLVRVSEFSAAVH